MNEDIVIKAINIQKSFTVGTQEISILKGVDFEVKKGDFAIILGPSGSGKSTLLHILLGLEEPTTGQIICLGTDLYALKTEDERSGFRKKHIGMVYQQPNWIKSLSVLENVAFPLSLLGTDRVETLKKAWLSLQNLGMEKWVNYIPTELSGGQQQKVALARALVTDPEMIIADEPTGNLDFESGQMLIQLLVALNNKGKTILMVTHDLEYVKYGKTAIRIMDGKILDITSGAEKEAIENNAPKKRGVEKNTENAAAESVPTTVPVPTPTPTPVLASPVEPKATPAPLPPTQNTSVPIEQPIVKEVVKTTPQGNVIEKVEKKATFKIKPDKVKSATLNTSPSDVTKNNVVTTQNVNENTK